MDMDMEETLTDVVQSTKQFKIGGFSVTSTMTNVEIIRSKRWNVAGYDWEVRVLPKYFSTVQRCDCVALYLHLCSEAPTHSTVKAKISCRLIDSSGKLKPYQGAVEPCVVFKHSGEVKYLVFLVERDTIHSSGYLQQDDSLIVECTLTVLRVVSDRSCAAGRPENDLTLSSGLHNHLGELLQKGTGADVTFLVSGESFRAHKAILASRSPVFMAEFFGHKKEESSHQVEINNMEPSVFEATLRFIYTDSAPALDRREDGVAVAQHLLVAADRYGIDRLKIICEQKLYDGIGVETAASTLALAEQHTCSRLKSKCLELISTKFEAFMSTEGYKNILMASCPSFLTDLLKAVHGKRN
ncbi:hypothetical protein PR202_gb28164 [Eleusine coracana subsp. coracana]|uniref:BTB domain-containing protein n=1 Tax=Eleusine coracana subsp. coracana TaxID=191504 RepID=A0AAV5FX72_ELECO|nr:hypothetical protein PR202_gb28164 [Eleusine coracana subsp. coracana]